MRYEVEEGDAARLCGGVCRRRGRSRCALLYMRVGAMCVHGDDELSFSKPVARALVARIIPCCSDRVPRSATDKPLASGGAQVVHVLADEVAAAPEVGLVHDARLLRHVGHAPEDGLLDEESVSVRHVAERPRRVVFPRVHDVELVPARARSRA